MAKMNEDMHFLLSRIRDTKKRGWPVTHKNIWAGSYDVWYCEQDRIDSAEIPQQRMKQAVSLGLIESEMETKGKYQFEVWKLTELGKQELEIHETNARSQLA